MTDTFMEIHPAGKTTTHSGRGVQEEEQWYLFFSKAVEGQLFLYSVASVDHQTGVCRAEGSQAERWAVIL